MARASSAWGLDIGTTALKAIKLRRDGDRVSVEAFEVIEHEHFLTEADTDRDATIQRSLAIFLEKQSARRDAIIVGVPGSSTFARFVKLPPVEPKRIPEIVKFEAIQQVPFPLDQVNWDYQTFQTPDSPEIEVGIFAMKKELVSQFLNNFKQNNLTVSGVQMSPLAVFNGVFFDEAAEGKGTVVLDIGAEHTDLIVVDQNRLWLRSVNIGGNAFTDALAKSFKIDFKKAESLKRTAATSKYAKQIYQAMRPIFNDLVAEIQRSIGFYNSTHRDSRLERVIGMGNPFKLPNLQKYIQQELKMEVLRLETFRKANIDGKVEAGLQEHILGMPAAYGLALQGLDYAEIDTNLLPTEIARQMVWRQKRAWFAAAALTLVAGVGVGTAMAFVEKEKFNNSTEATKVDHDKVINDANSIKQKYQSVSDTYANSEANVKSLTNLASERAIWPSVIHDIFSSLPQARNPADAAPTLERTEQKLIVIKTINTQYLSAVPKGTVGAASGTPAAAPTYSYGGGGGGGMPGGYGGGPPPGYGGGGGMPPGSYGGGGPDYGADYGMPMQPVASAAASGPHGFIITIRGYTPHSAQGAVVLDFANAIAKQSEEKTTKKPYYFEMDPKSPYSGFQIRQTAVAGGGGGGAINTAGFWGLRRGPYWDAIVPEMLGVKITEDRPGGPGMPGGGPAFGATEFASLTARPIDPDVKNGSLVGYFEFTTTFKVILKDPDKDKDKK